jgi:hypothetical protein
VALGRVDGFSVKPVEDGFAFALGSDFVLLTSKNVTAVLDGKSIAGSCKVADSVTQTVIVPLLRRSADNPLAVAEELEALKMDLERAQETEVELQAERDDARKRLQRAANDSPQLEFLKKSLNSNSAVLKMVNESAAKLRQDLQTSNAKQERLYGENQLLSESAAEAKLSLTNALSRICSARVAASLDFVDRQIGPASGRPAEQEKPEMSRAVGEVANAIRQTCL